MTYALMVNIPSEIQHYNAIMVKAIADRLAEAFAELIHQRVRKEWGFPDGPGITNQDPRGLGIS